MSTLSDLDSSELRRTPSAAARARHAAQLGSAQPRDAVSPMRRMAMNQLRRPASPAGRAASAERERRGREQRASAALHRAEASPSHRTDDPVKLAGNWTDGSSVAVSSAASDIASSVVVGSGRRRARVPGQLERKTRSWSFNSNQGGTESESTRSRSFSRNQGGTESESDDSESNASVSSSEWSTSTSDSADSSSSGEARGRSPDRSQHSHGQEPHRHDTRPTRAARAAQNQFQRRRRHFQHEHSSDWGDSDSESSTASIDDSALHRTHAGSRGRHERRKEGERRGDSRSRSRSRSRGRSDRGSSRSRSPKRGRRPGHGRPTRARGRTSSRSRSRTLSKLVEQTVGHGPQRHDTRRERAARAAQKLPPRHTSRKRHDRERDYRDDTDYSSFAASDSLDDDSTTNESTENEFDRPERQFPRRRRRNREALQQALEDQQLLKFFNGWRQATVRATVRKRRLQKDAEKARRTRSNRIQEAELGRQVREMARKQEQEQQQSLRGRSPARLVHKHVPPSRLETTLSSPIQHRSEARHLERQDEGKLRVESVSPNISQSRLDGPVLQNTDRPVIHRVRGRRVQSVQVSPSSSPTDMPRQQGQQGQQGQQQQQQQGQQQQQQRRRQRRRRPQPEAWTTPAAREIAGVVECPPESALDQRPSPEPEPEPEPAADIGGGVAQPSEVPQGWETAHSKGTGKVYYINHWTRELQYEYPAMEALPPGWTAVCSTTTGEKRYVNAFSGHTQLEFPGGSADAMEDSCLSAITVDEPRRTASPLGLAASPAAVPQAELEPRSAAHWEFLRKEYETSGIATHSGVKSLESVSALLFKVATEMHNEHTASNLAHGRKFNATDGARIRNPSGIWRSSLPLDLLAKVFERCGRDVEAAHTAQEEMSSRIVHLEGLLADEHSQREKLESSQSALVERTDARIAQTEMDVLQEHEELQRRIDAADAARLHAEKITKSCERKIAAARQKTTEVAEKLRLAELELTKRQNARDPATLREQLERVRTEKVTLDQQLQASEHRAQLLEAEKEDLARRLALLSLDKTAKKRWTEAKHATNQSPVKPAPLLVVGASSVAIPGSANAAGTSSELSCRAVHQAAKTIAPAAPIPPARPDGHSIVSGQKSPLASTLTNFASNPKAGRGDMSATKKHRPPPPAR